MILKNWFVSVFKLGSNFAGTVFCHENIIIRLKNSNKLRHWSLKLSVFRSYNR